MTAAAAGMSERERLARALFESAWKMPGTYPWWRQPKSTKDISRRQADKLLAAGFGDVAAIRTGYVAAIERQGDLLRGDVAQAKVEARVEALAAVEKVRSEALAWSTSPAGIGVEARHIGSYVLSMLPAAKS